MKKVVLGSVILVTSFFLSGCTNKTEGGDISEDFNQNSCYEECVRFGGGEENVEMCKKNCDASFDEDSVWNDDETDVVADNDASFDSWEEMPLAVPEFMYGDFVTGEAGMGSWIVDYENINDPQAMEKYVDDLEIYDWSVSYMETSHMLTGSKEGYTISASFDPEYGTLQIIVRKAN